MKRPRSSRRKGSAHDLGPDNLHADLGLPNADERLLKSILVSRIRAAVVDRKLTQAKARKIMDLSSEGCRISSPAPPPASPPNGLSGF